MLFRSHSTSKYTDLAKVAGQSIGIVLLKIRLRHSRSFVFDRDYCHSNLCRKSLFDSKYPCKKMGPTREEPDGIIHVIDALNKR